MKQNKYTLGLDFGTESVRCLAVDVNSGEEKGVAVSNYLHGVITENFPGTNVMLGRAWALQNPSDWIISLEKVIHCLLQEHKIS